MHRWVTQLVVSAIVVALGAIAVIELRDATLSTHQHVPPDTQIELLVRVERNGGNAGSQSLGERAEALVTMCRLEVKSDVVSLDELDGGLFRAVLQPSMDPTDRRQFRGCLEDWSIDHVRADVLRLEELE